MLTAKEFLEQDEVRKLERRPEEDVMKMTWTNGNGETVRVVGER